MKTLSVPIRLLFCLSVLWLACSASVLAQKYYPIVKRAYYPNEFDNSCQSNLAQDETGSVYYGYSGNTDEHFVIEFNGSHSRSILMPDRVSTLQIDTVHHRLYVGSESSFGYIQTDEPGELKYKPLLENKENDTVNFVSEVSHIFVGKDEVAFYSANKIYVFGRATMEPIKTASPPAEFNFSSFFVHGGAPYCQTSEGRWYTVAGGELKAAGITLGSFQAGEEEILFYSPLADGSTLIGARDFNNNYRLYSFNNNAFDSFVDNTKKWLGNGALVNAVQINDLIILATQSNGLVVLNSSGGLDSRIQSAHGLPDNEILNMFADANGRLWLTHKGQVSWNYLNLRINDFVGLTGSINAIEKIGDKVYIGASDGLYTLSKGADAEEMKAFNLALQSVYQNDGGAVNVSYKNYTAKLAEYNELQAKVTKAKQNKKKVPGDIITKLNRLQNELNKASAQNQYSYKNYTQKKKEIESIQKTARQQNRLDYKLISNLNGERCLSLAPHQNRALVAGTSSRIYLIKGNSAEVLNSKIVGGYLTVSNFNKNRFFIQRTDGKKNVFSTFVIKDDKADDKDRREFPLDGEITSIAEVNDGVLLIGMVNKALLLDFTNGYEEDPQTKNVALPNPKAGAIKVVRVGALILGFTATEIYVYSGGKFTSKPELTQYLDVARPVYSHSGGDIWSVKNRILYKIKASGDFKAESTRILRLMDRVETIYAFDNSPYLFLGVKYEGADHLIKLDLGKSFPSDKQQLFVAGFKRITHFDTTVTSNTQIELDYQTSFQYVNFQLAAPFYDNPLKPLFEYRIEGENTEHGDSTLWQRTTSTELNLPFSNWGSYTVRVRAVDVFGNYSREAVFLVRVARPFYANPFFWVAVALAIVGSVVYYFRWRQKALERSNAILDAKVKEQTTELVVKNEELHQRAEEIKAQNEELERQQQLLQEQKLAVEKQNAELEEKNRTIVKQQTQMAQMSHDNELGKYVPVFAHEIKTPVMAIKGALEAMTKALPESYALTQQATLQLLPEERALVFNLVGRLSQTPITMSTEEARKQTKRLEKLFEDQDMENADDVAKKLVAIGMVQDDALNALEPLLKNEQKAELAVDLLYKIGLLWKQLNMMQHSTTRTTDFLKTIQTYVYTGSHAQGEKFEIDLSENIDVVLALHDYHIRQGVSVTKNYGAIPKILASAKELQQVWANLILNAVKAMNNHGKLSIDIRQDGAFAEVVIADNGPGIPAENQARIFEPGFTTGKKGESTGMGLAIVKNIIDTHGGEIKLESVPGETKFIVRLPING